MLQTLGDVITCALAIAAVVLVPAAIIRAWWPEVSARIRSVIMSRPGETHARAADTEAVHVAVLSTDTTASAADDGEMPRIGRRLSDSEIVAVLAAQRGADNKYRFSANEIYGLVKGPRAEVLRQIREIRDGPGEPIYPPAPHPLEKFKIVN